MTAGEIVDNTRSVSYLDTGFNTHFNISFSKSPFQNKYDGVAL